MTKWHFKKEIRMIMRTFKTSHPALLGSWAAQLGFIEYLL